jgi:hypothetical protein
LRISNIKYIHINNKLLLEVLTKKINNSRKTSVLTLIRKSLIYAKVAKINFLYLIKKINNNLNSEYIANFNIFIKKNKEIIKNIFYGNSNIHFLGLKLEAKGRISKRLTASRSLKKVSYKGNLINIYSTINKNSTFNFKGFEKSNINYVKNNNYNILGTYGLKY